MPMKTRNANARVSIIGNSFAVIPQDQALKSEVEAPENNPANKIKSDNEESDSSEDSMIESDEEDCHTNVLRRMQKIKERKQELIKRLKLHEAASNLGLSLRAAKTGALTKRKTTTAWILPKRKSLRLQNIEASTNLEQKIETQPEEIEVARLPTSEYPVKPCDLYGDETDEKMIFENLGKSVGIEADQESISKNPELQTYVAGLKAMKSNGCVSRKVVEKRIYSIALHPYSFLLVAAASTGGLIGLWKPHEEKADEKEVGSVCHFSTYQRTISNILFPKTKPLKLFFSSYAGVVRSLDLEKAVFDQAVWDSEEVSASTFEFQDSSCNTVLIGCDNGDVTVADVRSQSVIAKFDAHNRIIKSISTHPLHNHYFSTSSNDRLVKIYDFRQLSNKMKAVHQVKDHLQTIDSAYFSPVTGSRLLTTSLDNRIRVYDTSVVHSPTLVSNLPHDNRTGRWLSNFRAVWHPALEDVVVVGSMERPVRQIDVFNSKLQRLQTLIGDNLTSVCSLIALHSSRQVIAGGNSSGKVFLFES